MERAPCLSKNCRARNRFSCLTRAAITVLRTTQAG
jgi:hypothetical protein